MSATDDRRGMRRGQHAAHSRSRGTAILLLASLLGGCGGDGGGTGPTDMLGPQPVAVSPAAGTQVATDRPTFTVRNASGYDAGQAQYTFQVTTSGLGRPIASATVAAGSGTTSLTFPDPLPRGMNLTWRAVARKSGGEAASSPTTFRLPAVACLATGNGYARRVVASHLPFCPLSPNVYNDTEEALGPPDAIEIAPGLYQGFVSLGDGGWVAVDMESCAVDGPGNDVRVFQAVGSEPLTLYAGGTENGPWILVEEHKVCDTRTPGGRGVIRQCDFDLAAGEVQQARYFKVEDAERTPCESAGTDSEGADLDAVQILNLGPAGG